MEAAMIFNFTHPVVVKGVPLRQREQRTIVGTVQTDVEVEEFSAIETDTAFEADGMPGIISCGGAHYRLSDIDLAGDMQNLDGTRHDIYLLQDEFSDALIAAVPERYTAPLAPKSSILDVHLTYRIAFMAMDYLRTAGPLSRRQGPGLEEGVEEWRDKAKRYARSFILVDGRMFERCHEPVLIASGSGVIIGNFELFDRYPERPWSGRRGWRSGSGPYSGNPTEHAFSLDRLDEALELAASMRKPWHRQVETPAYAAGTSLSTQAQVIDLDTLRIARGMTESALLFFDNDGHGVTSPTSERAAYEAATHAMRDILVEYGTSEDATAETVASALRDLSEAATGFVGRQRDPREMTEQVREAVDLHLSRRETSPISIASFGPA